MTWQEGWVESVSPTWTRAEILTPTCPCQGMAERLQSLGAEKEVAQQECEAFLSARPMGPAALQLPVALNNVKNKYSDMQVLCSLYRDK